MKIIPLHTRVNSGTSSPPSLMSLRSPVYIPNSSPNVWLPAPRIRAAFCHLHAFAHITPSTLSPLFSPPASTVSLLSHLIALPPTPYTHKRTHTHTKHMYPHRHLCLLKSFLFSKQARCDSKATTFINLSQSCPINPAKINLFGLCVSNDHL